jgi:hypothetical protein
VKWAWNDGPRGAGLLLWSNPRECDFMAASYLGWQPMAWFRGTQVGRGGLFDAESRLGSPRRTDSRGRIGWSVQSRRFQVDVAAAVSTSARPRYVSRGRLKIQIDNKSCLPVEDWPKRCEKRLFEIAGRCCDSWRGA